MYMLITGQKYIHIKLCLTLVDSQFPLSPSPNYSWVRAQRINLHVHVGKKSLTRISFWSVTFVQLSHIVFA